MLRIPTTKNGEIVVRPILLWLIPHIHGLTYSLSNHLIPHIHSSAYSLRNQLITDIQKQ